MTFSEMLDAAWELANAASEDLSISAEFKVGRHFGTDGPFQTVRYAISATNNRHRACSVYIVDNTTEHTLGEFKRQLSTLYPAPDSVVKTIDEAEKVQCKLSSYSAKVILCGIAGEMPMDGRLPLNSIPVVGERLHIPRSNGDFVITSVREVSRDGDRELTIKADITGACTLGFTSYA